MRVAPLAALLSVIALTACSDPKEIVLGPDPLKELAEHQKEIAKLSEEERQLLAGYLMRTELAGALGGKAPKVAGMKVGEVIAKARELNAQEEAERKKAAAEAEAKKAEADALRARVLAEREAIARQISDSAVVSVVTKRVLPKNYEIGRYSAMLTLTYAIQNKSQKRILQVKGEAVFRDATGDEVGSLSVDIDEPVAAGKTLTTDTGRGWKLKEFMNTDIEKIAGRDFALMKATFEPESIAFEGGEVLRMPEAPGGD